MRAVIVALVASVVLAGCGGSDDDNVVKPAESASPSSTASPASGDAVAPASVKPTRPDDVLSEEGAKAYSVFVMQNIVYTISTNDSEPLLGLSDGDSCASCVSLAKASDQSGDVVQIPDADIPIADITAEKRDDTSYIVRQVLQSPKVEYTNLKTDEVTKTDPAEDLKVTSVVKWKDQKWVLDNYGTTEQP